MKMLVFLGLWSSPEIYENVGFSLDFSVGRTFMKMFVFRGFFGVVRKLMKMLVFLGTLALFGN